MREGNTLTVVSGDYAATFPVEATDRIESRVTYAPKPPSIPRAAQ